MFETAPGSDCVCLSAVQHCKLIHHSLACRQSIDYIVLLCEPAWYHQVAS